MNRLSRFRNSIRGFSSSAGSGSSGTSSKSSEETIIRSGGKSSYIGFGKFESMSGESGSIRKGLEYLKEALNVHSTSAPSADHLRERARFHHDIAMCHHRDGDVSSAQAEYDQAINILSKLLTETPEVPENKALIRRVRFDLSSALSGSSVALADEGRDELSLERAEKALELRKSVMGPNHASVAECLNTLGGLYFRQSQFNKAAEVYQESLRILLTKTEGKDENKYVALAYYNIGLTYDKLGVKKGGFDAVQKALLIANHIWGPNHDQTIQIQSTLDELVRGRN